MAASTPGAALAVGQVIEGTVTGITRFGAFVALPNGQTGLVHISEVADTYVRDIADYVHENETVQVKVLSMDDRGKIALSIRQAKPGSSPTRPRSGGGGGGGGRRNAPPATFEDKLARFMKDSQDRLTDLKRHTESRRGGRGS
jgi:S1 RNA binding domain protein